MIKLENICRSFRSDEVETRAIDDVNLEIAPREFVAIMGPSGCGKTTLLHLLGLLDRPTGGRYFLNGEDVARCSEQELARRRRESVGFIFQNFNLIDDLSVADNVEVGLLYRRVEGKARRQRVLEVLDKVGIAHRARHMPRQLSGGQQQRVAIARALVCKPSVIFADEPTGNLDTANGEVIMSMLKDMVQAGTTVVMVTHSLLHASAATRTIHLLDGRVVTSALVAV